MDDDLNNDEEKGAFARRTDPFTSHDAADLVNFSRLEYIVATTLREHGPSTSSEISLHAGKLDGSITPRLRRMVNKGKLVDLMDKYGRQVTRKSLHSNRQQQIWALPEQVSRYEEQDSAGG